MNTQPPLAFTRWTTRLAISSVALPALAPQNTPAYPPAVGILGKAKEGMIGSYFERRVKLKVID